MRAALGGLIISEGRCECCVSHGRNQQALRVDHLHDLCGNGEQFQPLHARSGFGEHGGGLEEASLAGDESGEDALGIWPMHIGAME